MGQPDECAVQCVEASQNFRRCSFSVPWSDILCFTLLALALVLSIWGPCREPLASPSPGWHGVAGYREGSTYKTKLWIFTQQLALTRCGAGPRIKERYKVSGPLGFLIGPPCFSDVPPMMSHSLLCRGVFSGNQATVTELSEICSRDGTYRV